MCCHLAFIESFVLLPGALNPQRPVAEVPRVLHQEPVVAAVRGQAHRQQLKVLSPKPGYLCAKSGLNQIQTHLQCSTGIASTVKSKLAPIPPPPGHQLRSTAPSTAAGQATIHRVDFTE